MSSGLPSSSSRASSVNSPVLSKADSISSAPAHWAGSRRGSALAREESFKISIPAFISDLRKGRQDNSMSTNMSEAMNVRSNSSVMYPAGPTGSRQSAIGNGMKSKMSLPQSTSANSKVTSFGSDTGNLEDIESTLKSKMQRMSLSFLDNGVEMEYERFFLKKTLRDWRRNLCAIFFFCTALYLFFIVENPSESSQWRSLYSLEQKISYMNQSGPLFPWDQSIFNSTLINQVLELNGTSKLLETTFICPHGWFCVSCDPDLLCGDYIIEHDILFWIFGLLAPFAAAISTSINLTSTQIGRCIHLISCIFTSVIVIVGVFIRFLVLQPYTPVYQPAILGITLIITCLVFLRVRFLYALGTSVFSGIAYIAVFYPLMMYSAASTDITPIVGVTPKSFLFNGLALTIILAVVTISCYDTETFYRGQFMVSFTLQKHNAKLTNQLKVLQKVYTNKAADFDSPLEKSVMIIRSMMADPTVKAQHLMELSQLLNLLGSSNLLAPDLENQVTEFMDTEQEAWLFSEIAPRRKNHRRQSLTQVQRLRRQSFAEKEGLKIAETISEAANSNSMHSIIASNVKSTSVALSPVMSPSISVYNGNAGTEAANTNDATTYQRIFSSGEMPQSVSRSPSAMALVRPTKIAASFDDIYELPRVANILNGCNEFNWPIFDFVEAANGRSLSVLAFWLFKRENLFNQFQIPTDRFWKFILAIEQGYRSEIPYHNATHACDVLHCIAHLASFEHISSWTSEFDILALYVAAIVHDFDHPGYNNNFLVNTYDVRTILYNDKSVLENHHLASAFTVLNKTDCNFLSHLPRADFKALRESVIEMVLATDLSQHFVIISMFKNKLAQTFDPEESRDDRILLWKILMKCSDVSNPTKEWSLYERWCRLVLEEFMRQGDMEKRLGIPVSPYMDRDNINVPSSQIGFIDYVIFPLFEAFDKYLPIPHITQHLRRNRDHWGYMRSLNVIHMASVVPPPPLVSHAESSGSVGNLATRASTAGRASEK